MESTGDFLISLAAALFANLGHWLLTWWVVLLYVSAWRIFKRAGRAGWASLVPFYSTLVFLDVAGWPRWFFLLLLVPGLNLVLLCLMCADVARRFGRSALFGVLGLGIFGFVGWPWLAATPARYQDGDRQARPAPQIDRFGILLTSFLIAAMLSIPFALLTQVLTAVALEVSLPFSAASALGLASLLVSGAWAVAVWHRKRSGVYGFAGWALVTLITSLLTARLAGEQMSPPAAFTIAMILTRLIYIAVFLLLIRRHWQAFAPPRIAPPSERTASPAV